MWIADRWKEFRVLDASGGEKLEEWGPYRLIRPDPQVIWNTPRDSRWEHVNGHYHRSSKGGGDWEFFGLPETWQISYETGFANTLTFNLKPFRFKHTGLFPEQAANWEWFGKIIADETARRGESGSVRVLNLFAYTGGATLAAAAAGASVTHVDAAKGMVAWAKENAASSGLSDAPIRWLTDDCLKFVLREERRGKRYDAIIMDPPSYGRGPGGEVWKLEDKLYELLEACSRILSDEALFFLINSYTTGLQPGVLKYMLSTVIAPGRKGNTAADEIGLPVAAEDGSSLVLPCGASGRWMAC